MAGASFGRKVSTSRCIRSETILIMILFTRRRYGIRALSSCMNRTVHHLIADMTIRRDDWGAYLAEAEYNGGSGGARVRTTGQGWQGRARL